MRNPFRRHRNPTALTFPTHLETAEQTLDRMARDPAAYVSKHWTRR